MTVVEPGDSVFTCGFVLHSRSSVVDAEPIIRSCEVGKFYADDFNVAMALRGAPEFYEHTSRSI